MSEEPAGVAGVEAPALEARPPLEERVPAALRPVVVWARRWFERTEPAHGPVMLLAGATWDWLTLTRIDRIADNLFLLAYLLILGFLLILERRIARGAWAPAFLVRHPTWVYYATQFFFGGLYSAYVIYYAKSAPPGRALLYVGLLTLLLCVNELADRHLRGDVFRFGLYFFCVFSFLLFFVPVTTGLLIGFVPAGIGAIAVTSVVVAAVHAAPSDPDAPRAAEAGHAIQGWSVPRAIGTHGAIHLVALLVLTLLGSAGIVPPVPLALQQGGLFHDVTYTADGYRLTWEQQGLLRRHNHVFRRPHGETVWCYSAIFAPRGLAVEIVHLWERWDPEQGWVTTDRLAWQLQGGRDRGFRGFTRKRNVAPGHWRVRVQTAKGRPVHTFTFEVREEPLRRPLRYRFDD